MFLVAAPAWAVDLWTKTQPYVEKLAVWRGYEQELQTLAIYGIGIAIYTALVFTFYQNLSKRKPFHFKISDRPGFVGRFGRFSENAVVFPVVSFLYFAVLATSLFVLAKSQSVHQILLIAMSVVVAVRVTVYLSEAMSNDLSKLVPLSLLGVLLVDPGYLTLRQAGARIGEAMDLWPLLGRYFLLFIALEVVMGVTRASILRAGRASRGVRRKVGLTIPSENKETTFTLDVKEGSTPGAPAEPASPGAEPPKTAP